MTLTIMRIAMCVLIAAAVSGCVAIDRWSGVSQARELQTTGESAEATILRIWDTGMTVNNDPVVGFLLEVRPRGQCPYQAETKLRISRVQIPQFQPGAVVPVRFDRQSPSRVSLDIYNFSQ